MFRLPLGLRFSIAELIALTVVVGLCLAAMRVGGWFAATVQFVAILLAIGLATTAATNRGATRAWAIGFLIGAAIYGSVVLYLGDEEFDPSRGTLLTTRAFEPAFDAMTTRSYSQVGGFGAAPADAELETIRVTPRTPMNFPGLNGESMPTTYSVTVNGKFFGVYESPSRQEFMIVAHLLVALALGYVAAKFAAATYRRPGDRPSPTPVQASES